MRRIAIPLLLLLLTLSASGEEWLSGTWVRAERKLDEAIARARAARDRTGAARLLARRAHFLLDRSSYHHYDPDRARQAIDQALTAAEESADRFALASAIQARGRWQYWAKLLRGTGDWETIDATLSEALRIRQEIGDRAGQSESWFYRGLVRQMQEQYGPAREAFERSLRLAEDSTSRSFAERHLGYVLQLAGERDAAQQSYQNSLQLRRRAGAHVLVPFAINLVADFELETTKNRARVKALFRESASAAQCAKSWRALNAAEGRLAQLEIEDGQTARARRHALTALEAARKYGDSEMIAEAEKTVEALRVAR